MLLFTIPAVIIFGLIINPVINVLHSKDSVKSIEKTRGANLNITMLGAAKTGKTTLLACMLRELMSMSKKLSGFQAGFQVMIIRHQFFLFSAVFVYTPSVIFHTILI